MNRIIAPVATLLAVAIPLAVAAHPGHGETEGFSIIHYFSEPVHALASVAGLGILLFVLTRYFSRKSGDKNA